MRGHMTQFRDFRFKNDPKTMARVEDLFGRVSLGDRFIFPAVPDPLINIESGKPCRVTEVTLEGVTFRRWFSTGHYSWSRLELEASRGLSRWPTVPDTD